MPHPARRTSIDQTQSLVSHLPAEIWLQILEQVGSQDVKDLWTLVRHVSRRFRDLVEKLFRSLYLPRVTITLPLPRRDANSGKLCWPGEPVPAAQLIMVLDHVLADSSHAIFKSPICVGDGSEMRTVELLRKDGVLPVARLEAAPPWVNIGQNPMTGLSLKVLPAFEWSDDAKVYTWRLDWQKLVSQYYLAKQDSLKNSHGLRSRATARYRRSNRDSPFLGNDQARFSVGRR